MSDVTLFLRNGWHNIWKEKTIFLFASLSLVGLFFRVEPPLPKNVLWLWSLLTIFISLFFTVTSLAGVTYISYCVSIGEPVTIGQSWQAARIFRGRIAILIFLIGLLISPCLCSSVLFSFTQPLQLSYITHNAFLLMLPLNLFVAWWHFSLAGMVINGLSIRKSVKVAWQIFINHFGILVLIGIISGGAWYLLNILLGMVVTLVQSNFDTIALSKIDYITPFLSFSDNGAYLLVSTIGSVILNLFSTTTFMSAYLKYTGVKAASRNQARWKSVVV